MNERKGFENLSNNTFGIDLGTSTIKIYSAATGKTLIEKNMIAIEGKNNLFAYGDSAFEMYEKAPDNISISYPLCNGVIADIKHMQTLLHYFLNDASEGNLHTADFYVAVPTDITEVEKRAFFDLVKDANVKSKKIMIVEKAVADGLGLGIDVKNSQGVMMVNVGYHTTEISILSLGGIVLSKLIKNGGLKFDDSIRAAIRREYNLLVGGKTAESVKIALRELKEKGDDAIVYGRDIVTGLPMERKIPTSLVEDCMKEHFNVIIDNVRIILERTPPELAADIYRNGIYLTGGGSLVGNFSQIMANGTGLKVNHSDDASTSVIRGLEQIIKDDKYRSIAYTIEGMSKS